MNDEGVSVDVDDSFEVDANPDGSGSPIDTVARSRSAGFRLPRSSGNSHISPRER